MNHSVSEPAVSSSPIVNIAAYQFFRWDHLEPRRDELKSLCKRLQLKGTILLSGEGINMFLAGTRSSIDAFLAHIRQIPELSNLEIKESLTDYQPFNRMLVRLKREIIPVGIENVAPVQDASPKISPEQLKRWLDEKKPLALLDTRNDYEVDLGTFENAIDLRLKTFREFPKAAEALPEEVKQQPVVMFCTGGIRCEKIGPYMKGLGFQEIYQLDGGILKYFEQCQQAHYQGDCFVFDQRVAIDPTLQPSDASECFACKHPLSPEDLESEKYVPSESCPHCYQSPQEKQQTALANRQETIVRITKQQRGSTPYENKRWISIPQRCAGMQLIDALGQIYGGYSREQWLQAIAGGEIQIPTASKTQFQCQSVVPDRIVREGERFLHCMQNYTEPTIDPNIQLVYEDEALVVVNKSAPLPVHPSGRFNLNTLESILQAAYHPEKLRPAHRLDAATTGLVVFTRKFAFAKDVQSQFQGNQVHKVYHALVHGSPTWDMTECELPIGSTPLASGGRSIETNGQPAKTLFQVLERREDGSSIVEAIPITGRTHQIRLHLAAIGHPIVNDPLYGESGVSRLQPDESSSNTAMGLHSYRLEFTHPTIHQKVVFTAERQF